MSHSKSKEDKTKPFSVSNFVIVIVASFTFYFFVMSVVAPSVWHIQIQTSITKLALVFLVWHLIYAFVEHPFHRYVLHCPLIPGLSYFYRSHIKHHALTRIVNRKIGGVEYPVVENVYPIVEKKQHEASFFPWYSWLVFALIMTGPMYLMQRLLPNWPIFLGGCLALAWSLSLYEIVHAIEHYPLEKWLPKLNHPNPHWERFWWKVYTFHLRHHADIKCNEGISGFFGIPVADFVFGTWVTPSTLYPHGEIVDLKEFKSPKPRWFIQWLDDLAERQKNKRREKHQTLV